jgi:hypothetical protein
VQRSLTQLLSAPLEDLLAYGEECASHLGVHIPDVHLHQLFAACHHDHSQRAVDAGSSNAENRTGAGSR